MSQWTVTRLGRKGDGVAEGEAGRVLAALTLPGEVIEGEAVEGRLAAPRILQSSDQRVRPICGHYRACGGCSLMHASDAFTTGWKRQVVETAFEIVAEEKHLALAVYLANQFAQTVRATPPR